MSGFGLVIALLLLAQSGNAKKQVPGERPSFEELTARAKKALETDQTQQAIALYSRATRLRPQWSEGWWRLGTLSFDTGKFDAARDAFRRFVDVEKKQPGPGYGMLGLCEFQLKHFRESRIALERGLATGLGANADFARSILYHAAILNTLFGQPELAGTRLTRVVNQTAAAHPDNATAAVLSDSDLVIAVGLAALRRPMLPADVPPEQRAVVAQAGRAQAIFALSDRPAAGREFEELTARYPKEPGVHYAYGVFLLRDDPPRAIPELQKEIAVSPTDVPARLLIALECLRIGDYEQGQKYASEALSLAPENFVAHIAAGRLWLALDKTTEAIRELTAAVKLAPDSPDAHFALSRAYAQAGRPQDAARERAEFERLRPAAK